MLLDHPIISQRYFFPRRQPFTKGLFEVDVGEARLACFRQDGGHARTFVHFHGNGEVVADYLPDYADAIAAMGANLLFVEYRGYGGSTGEPKLGAMLGDVGVVLEALGVPAEQLIVYGRSVGSIYAIEAAHRYPALAGLILESGIADPRQRLAIRMEPWELDTTAEELAAAAKAHLDHEAKLRAFTGRLLVMHAADDTLVPPDHARANHAWAGSADKELLLFPSGGHNGLLGTNWAAYSAKLAAFIAG